MTCVWVSIHHFEILRLHSLVFKGHSDPLSHRVCQLSLSIYLYRVKACFTLMLSFDKLLRYFSTSHSVGPIDQPLSDEDCG